MNKMEFLKFYKFNVYTIQFIIFIKLWINYIKI